MSKRRLGPLEFPVDTTFRWWHGIAWLAYLWVVKLNLEMLWEARQTGAIYLLPAIGLAWLAVFTAGAFIENWLDGANRHRTFRYALILSALGSFALGAWMLWHYTTFLLVGLITLFRQPFELISLSVFGTRLAAVCGSLATFALFAWLSLRVMRVLLSGERQAHLGHVLGEDAFGSDLATPRTGDPVSAPDRSGSLATSSPLSGPERTLRIALPKKDPEHAPGKPPAPPVPTNPAGKQFPLERPPALMIDSRSPGFPHGLSYRRGIAPDKVGRCRELGWASFEWVFRTQPSLEELASALEALPNLAQLVDEHHALQAREWMSKLADHPGAYEMLLPRQEVINDIGSVTIRIADVALQALMDWDVERRKRVERPPA